MKKYRITTTHTVIASSQEEALQKIARITAARPNKKVKAAEELADKMIEEAVKWAGKWGTEKGVGFVSIYANVGNQGVTPLSKTQVSKMLEKQKGYLIDTIENNGVATKSVLKGKTFNLDEGDFEDKVMEIFINYLTRLGIAVAVAEDEEILLQVFKNYSSARGDKRLISKSDKGISGGISAYARFSYKNIKPAFTNGIEGWAKMFKVLNKAA